MIIKKKIVLWTLLLFLGTGTIFAAVVRFTAEGIVFDAETYEPMPGVAVVIKGTTTGVYTNDDGEFLIGVKAGDKLMFSYVGYKIVEALAGDFMLIWMSPEPELK